jgi:hypothetical protein
VSADQPVSADGEGDTSRMLSVRAAGQRLLETSDAALTSSEIVTALRGIQASTSEKRFRPMCGFAVDSSQEGVVATHGGKNVLASR